jgi:hypothetical protein
MRIYREPSEIKRDITKINNRIEEVRDMINIRSLLMDILVGERADEPEDNNSYYNLL